MSEPLDPRDPSGRGSGPPDVSAAAERARRQLREDYKQLRSQIQEWSVGDDAGAGPDAGAAFRRKARMSLAALGLTAAVAAAAANFGLNGGRTPKQGAGSASLPSPEPRTGAIAAGRRATPGAPRRTPPGLFAAVSPGLRLGPLGSGEGNSPAASPSLNGPTPVFAAAHPVPEGGIGASGGNGDHGQPVRPPHSPVSPQPEAQPVAYSPPAPPAGGAGTGAGEGPAAAPGSPVEGSNSNGEGSLGGSGAKPVTSVVEPQPSGEEGNGLGKGHVNSQGAGHDGGSPGKGHVKYDGGGQTEEAGTAPEPPVHHAGGHGHSAGPAAVKHPAPPPAPPAPPSPPGPGAGPGSAGGPGKSGEAHGKASAPGQLKK